MARLAKHREVFWPAQVCFIVRIATLAIRIRRAFVVSSHAYARTALLTAEAVRTPERVTGTAPVVRVAAPIHVVNEREV